MQKKDLQSFDMREMIKPRAGLKNKETKNPPQYPRTLFLE
jgi:hypothetical protein